jgi:hypothetical protein
MPKQVQILHVVDAPCFHLENPLRFSCLVPLLAKVESSIPASAESETRKLCFVPQLDTMNTKLKHLSRK